MTTPEAGRAERTDDGRYIVIDGRRWRATDPAIPEPLRAELVHELMAARRAVGSATQDGDREAEAVARSRVGDAKVALGERGHPWWERPGGDAARPRLAAAMRALLRGRSEESTICPSDAARVAGGATWRDLMEQARSTAADLAAEGEIVVLRSGRVVDDPTSARGPIRLGRGPRLRS